MLDYLWLALGLMLVLEGLMPFLFPSAWRETLLRLIHFHDGQLRFLGLTLMLTGVLLIYLAR